MTIRLPDFVIGGAPRCGTTWLYEALTRHPMLWLARPPRPEPKYFLVDAEYDQGLQYYSDRWFGAAPHAALIGEKSTNYLESATSATRMAADLPGAKVIFLLREPAARALSNYLWSRANGLETATFGAALELEEQRALDYEGSLVYSRPFAYFERGLYAKHLRTWLALFPRDQVLISNYEQIAAAPEMALGSVHEFLGVPPRPSDAATVGVINASEHPQGEGFDEELTHLRARYRDPDAELETIVGCRFWAAR
jgi:hypothetical protein